MLETVVMVMVVAVVTSRPSGGSEKKVLGIRWCRCAGRLLGILYVNGITFGITPKNGGDGFFFQLF